MAGSEDLFLVADEYLQACVAALADTPDGAPAMAFVSPGPPSWDCCPMLTVHVGGPVIADTSPLQPQLGPMHRAARQGEVNVVQLVATILRCDPTLTEEGTLPNPAEMSAVAEQTNADLWAIWNFCRRAKYLNLLYPPKEREFAFDPGIAQAQQGGCCGWEIPIRVELDGYKTALLPPS